MMGAEATLRQPKSEKMGCRGHHVGCSAVVTSGWRGRRPFKEAATLRLTTASPRLALLCRRPPLARRAGSAKLPAEIQQPPSHRARIVSRGQDFSVDDG